VLDTSGVKSESVRTRWCVQRGVESHAASVLAVWGPYLPSTDLPERPTADCIDITAFIVRFPNLPSATAAVEARRRVDVEPLFEQYRTFARLAGCIA